MNIQDNIYDKALHYIGQNIFNPYVVILGAMDGVSFDETRGYIAMYDWKGLFVEPMPDQFTKLCGVYEDNKRYICENVAISDYDGSIKMLRIKPEIINSGLVHPCFGGMSAVWPPKNGLGSEGDRPVVEKYGEFINVQCVTPETLFTRNNISKFDIISIDTEGHDFLILKNINLIKYNPKVIRIEYCNLSDTEKQESIEYLIKNGYVYNVVGQNLDAVKKEFWDIVSSNNANTINTAVAHIPAAVSSPVVPAVDSNLTIVTGIWNLNRDQAGEGFKRPFSHYIDNFTKLLKTEANMVIFVDQEHVDFIWQHRKDHNTRVIVRNVADFKSNFAFYEQVQKIRNNPQWSNSAHWLKDSTQATLEMYNPMVMSKFFMLHDAVCFNHFNTDYFAWIDGGITNTVHEGYFTHDRVLDKVTKYLKKIFFLSFPYEGNTEIHGFSREGMSKYCNTDYVRYVCRGGFFGGHKDYIRKYNSTYYHLLQNTLAEGYMGTEESIFTIMAHESPQDFDRYILDDNGLVNKFFEAVKTEEVSVVTTQKHSCKTSPTVSLYAVSFNSPKQFEVLVESYLKHDKFITNTKNYLLDNSTDLSTTEEYIRLCKKYNFEHIKKQNLGICGGRQFIAEHFDTTDSDFYIFLEDDMNLMEPNTHQCVSGFNRYHKNLFDKSLKIINEEGYDFLKLCFSEFFGTNTTQWSWYNVPQHIREKYFPEKLNLPKIGTDPNAPKTIFKNIKNMDGLPYADGDIYYCNWPQFVSREGNTKMFLDTKWARPYEQTWMSHMFQLTKEDKLRGALLLLSPINHHRFDHYNKDERVES